MKDIVVVGIGYVGLPLAIMLAEKKYRVVGVDKDKSKVNKLNSGILDINEDDLLEIFQKDIVKKNLVASLEPTEGDIFVVAVPTPYDEENNTADLSYLKDSLYSIIPKLKPNNLIIIESTIPPQTCDNFITPIIEKNSDYKVGKDILLAHCPERILPGNIVNELINNDRIIGGVNLESSHMAFALYSSFVKADLHITDTVTAELCKLTENSVRDVNIALANELSLICDKINVDTGQLVNLVNHHPRVTLPNPGIGVGGHCIPIDPWFITQIDKENTTLIQNARKVNDGMPLVIAEKLKNIFKDYCAEPELIVLGLTYKPDSDDLRESPAIKVIKYLKEFGYKVKSYDPLIKGKKYNNILDITKGKDFLIVLVEHQIIKEDIENNYKQIIDNLGCKMILRYPFNPK